MHDVSHIHKLAPSQGAIRILRELLEKAEAGDCISVHAIWQDNKDVWSQARDMYVSDIPKLIGLLHMQIVNLTARVLTGESMMAEQDKIG